jgi:hypothetical protein
MNRPTASGYLYLASLMFLALCACKRARTPTKTMLVPQPLHKLMQKHADQPLAPKLFLYIQEIQRVLANTRPRKNLIFIVFVDND